MVELPFRLAEDEPEAPLAHPRNEGETLRKLHVFIWEHILVSRKSKAKSSEPTHRLDQPRTIVARLLILHLLLDPTHRKSLDFYARQMHFSPAYLSKIGLEISAILGINASWQRIEAASSYSSRAKAVHSGTHTPTPKWERRKLTSLRRQCA